MEIRWLRSFAALFALVLTLSALTLGCLTLTAPKAHAAQTGDHLPVHRFMVKNTPTYGSQTPWQRIIQLTHNNAQGQHVEKGSVAVFLVDGTKLLNESGDYQYIPHPKNGGEAALFIQITSQTITGVSSVTNYNLRHVEGTATRFAGPYTISASNYGAVYQQGSTMLIRYAG